MKTFLENLNKYWVTPIIAIVGGLLGLYFSVVKQDLETQAKNIENTAFRIETELKQKEFNNDLKLQMYNEVKNAIAHNDQKIQSAVLLIVNELLADDSAFRDKLINLLRVAPNTDNLVKEEIQRMVKTENAFFTEQTLKTEDNFTIDIFYLEDLKNEALPRAERVKEMLMHHYPDYRIRLRLLPRTVNARSGYRVEANEIRFNEGEEELAKKCQELLISEKIFENEQPSLYKVKRVTPNYLSIFVRNM